MPTSAKCPPIPSDIVSESRRAIPVEGDTWEEVAGRLKLSAKSKNRALVRMVNAYVACRKT